MEHINEIADCRRRIALGTTLNTLLINPEFRTVVVEGFLRDFVLERGLNINVDKSGSIQALKAAATFKKYLDYVKADAEQAQIDLLGYLNL